VSSPAFSTLPSFVFAVHGVVIGVVVSAAVQHERESRYVRYKRDGCEITQNGDTKIINSPAFDSCGFTIIDNLYSPYNGSIIIIIIIMIIIIRKK